MSGFIPARVVLPAALLVALGLGHSAAAKPPDLPMDPRAQCETPGTRPLEVECHPGFHLPELLPVPREEAGDAAGPRCRTCGECCSASACPVVGRYVTEACRALLRGLLAPFVDVEITAVERVPIMPVEVIEAPIPFGYPGAFDAMLLLPWLFDLRYYSEPVSAPAGPEYLGAAEACETRTEQEQVLLQVNLLEMRRDAAAALEKLRDGGEADGTDAVVYRGEGIQPLRELLGESALRVVMEPSLVTLSGRPACFFYNGGMWHQDVHGALTGRLCPRLSLRVTPQVIDTARIRLDVHATCQRATPGEVAWFPGRPVPLCGGVTSTGTKVELCRGQSVALRALQDKESVLVLCITPKVLPGEASPPYSPCCPQSCCQPVQGTVDCGERPEKVEALLSRCQAACSEGRLAAAAQLARQAAAAIDTARGQRVRVLMDEFNVALRHGKYAEAETYARRAAELDPSNAVCAAAVTIVRMHAQDDAWRRRGRWATGSQATPGSHETCEAEPAKAIDLTRSPVFELVTRFHAACREGQYAEAQGFAFRALVLAIDDPDGLAALRQACTALHPCKRSQAPVRCPGSASSRTPTLPPADPPVLRELEKLLIEPCPPLPRTSRKQPAGAEEAEPKRGGRTVPGGVKVPRLLIDPKGVKLEGVEEGVELTLPR